MLSDGFLVVSDGFEVTSDRFEFGLLLTCCELMVSRDEFDTTEFIGTLQEVEFFDAFESIDLMKHSKGLRSA